MNAGRWIRLLASVALIAGGAVVSGIEDTTDQTLFLKARLLYEEDRYDEAQALLEEAIALKPAQSEYHRWLGKTFGRTAEGAGWFSALKLAVKARKSFETAVALDGQNALAMRDLLEFYVAAPGIIGGGMAKARPLAKRLLALDPSFRDEVTELLAEGE